MTTLPTPSELRDRLTAMVAERGFLLPHHGALAAATPDLHDAYRTMYTALTLTDRHLSRFEREFVWLCILVASREAVGTHHLDLFFRSGGTQDQARIALHLTGYAGAAETFGFVEAHWATYFPMIDARRDYLAGVETLCGDLVPPATAHLAMAAVHTILRRPWGIQAHIMAVYAAPGGLSDHREEKLVEALSLAMWPAGVNRFVDATLLWYELIKTGAVTPSPLFQAWVDTPGLGAFAPAASSPNSPA